MAKTSRAPARFVIFALLVSAPAAAQSVQGGIKGGVSFSTLDGPGEVIGNLPQVNVDTRTNYLVGVFVKVNLAVPGSTCWRARRSVSTWPPRSRTKRARPRT